VGSAKFQKKNSFQMNTLTVNTGSFHLLFPLWAVYSFK